ncbi:MAG: 16S rRNA (guanine(966)-N(2))-methyltransferase RsmD [Deltaproteobacteria bacterium]|nr:16S rRNA (guanine(966)-N(2))-methyltransferase RsmD [Deltaproteobacteria bacterium]
MRVIGGTAKGRRVKSFKARSLRPTADRVKEALFNILPHDLTGWKVLDLFAGTGNLTFEALSRGAKEACLVDVSREASKMIRKNVEALGFLECTKVMEMPAIKAVHVLAGRGERFDLIFADPPYDKGWVKRVLKSLAEDQLLADEGTIVVEHSTREEVLESYGPLVLRDQRRYGSTCVSFFGLEHATHGR